jgi:hypothetical protein
MQHRHMSMLKIYIDHTGITRVFVDNDQVGPISKLSVKIDGDDPLPTVSISIPNVESGRLSASVLSKIPYVDIEYVDP